MQYQDYYKILGVERGATQDDIKRAYRKLARKYHPDVSKESDAEERFKEVGEAYEVLKDPEKRAAYDQLGNQWQTGQEFRPPPDWGANVEFSGDPAAFSDFFESLFGRGFGARRPAAAYRAAGMDHHARVVIDLADSFAGTTRSITLQRPVADAAGRVSTREHTLKVRIPKGVKPGQHIRLAGQGEPGIGGGAAGDLYLEIAFRPHPLYRIDGSDLYLELPVTPWEAALGATVPVPTPGGPVDLKVPPGSNGGRRLRLKGRGIPATPPGDLYVQLRIALPPADTPAARELYQRMGRELAFDPRQGMGV